MTFIQVLNSDIMQYVKFAVWVLLSILGIIFSVCRLVLRKAKLDTTKIDDIIKNLEKHKEQLLTTEQVDNLKNKNKINAKAVKLIDNLYKTLKKENESK